MRGIALVAVVAVLAGCGGTKTVTVERTVTQVRTVTAPPVATTTPPAQAADCTAGDLRGTFAVVPGSAAAGSISYRLTLTDTSASPCAVSGLPVVELLDAQGAPLPTHVSAAHPGQQTAARVVLTPGASATADARFSPDVAGTGDTQQPGVPCQPKASTLRVSIGGATLDAPVSPPTSVCERGSFGFDVYSAG